MKLICMAPACPAKVSRRLAAAIRDVSLYFFIVPLMSKTCANLDKTDFFKQKQTINLPSSCLLTFHQIYNMGISPDPTWGFNQMLPADTRNPLSPDFARLPPVKKCTPEAGGILFQMHEAKPMSPRIATSHSANDKVHLVISPVLCSGSLHPSNLSFLSISMIPDNYRIK
jgi:hypothetical protein